MGILPLAKGGGTLNGNSLFSLQIHGIHLCADTIFPSHIVNGVNATRVKEDAFRQCGFSTATTGNVPMKEVDTGSGTSIGVGEQHF